ncbi:MAG: hypothetical protein IIY02_03380, partial [Firmicutes bacterium]|nr:hypothetical protein [Bacillota bacterium]
VPYEEDVAETEETRFGTFLLGAEPLAFPRPDGKTTARVIGITDGQIVTEERKIPVADLGEHDIARAYVCERYGKNGNVGYGLIEGFGLKEGAIASSVAHDSHNLLILAADDEEATFAAQTVAEMGGGMCVVRKGEVLAKMALPVGGLMCADDAETVAKREKELVFAARELGIPLSSPFMTLAFMALPVIPKLKLTDMGLFDVDLFDFVSLYE